MPSELGHEEELSNFPIWASQMLSKDHAYCRGEDLKSP